MSTDQTLSEEDLRQALELLFFAYRDFTGEADTLLEDFGFGRAHHRVIYFVNRNPSISVNGLLRILKITKQSLSRVLGQLVREGFIDQKTDSHDRRRRTLTLTDKGIELESRLTKCQGVRMQQAFAASGENAVQGFKKVLSEMINAEDRKRYTGGAPHTD
ncbi:MAG: MarR family transcriptional regulator [Rhodospirillaceae bacterium]|nr:MAG: MarR family transcriptional regulator [Rhodospirillaceae bacterium]